MKRICSVLLPLLQEGMKVVFTILLLYLSSIFFTTEHISHLGLEQLSLRFQTPEEFAVKLLLQQQVFPQWYTSCISNTQKYQKPNNILVLD